MSRIFFGNCNLYKYTNQRFFLCSNLYRSFTSSKIYYGESNEKHRDINTDITLLQKQFNNVIKEEYSKFGDIPIFKRALLYSKKIAIKDKNREFTYGTIYNAAKQLGQRISKLEPQIQSRISYLCPNDITYLITQWGCWMGGNIAVPLHPKHPSNLHEYYIKDSQSNIIITTKEFENILAPIAINLNKQLIIINQTDIEENFDHTTLLDNDNLLSTELYNSLNALILYTSGTTGYPKGVVLTHKNINSQIKILSHAWQMNQHDVVLHVLPLNHVHGSINALLMPLYNGSKVVMLPNFNASDVWSYLLHINKHTKEYVNVFMAVPTIYKFLIDEYEKVFSKNIRLVEYIKQHCSNKIRLMVSGSSALPLSLFDKWYDITGNRLLERYGMTEIGMAISNTYIEDKNRKRISGAVGQPLPTVEVKILDPTTSDILYQAKGDFDKGYWSKNDQPLFENNEKKQSTVSGDLYVRGPNVFSHYYNKPQETKKDLSTDNWFRTGDSASYGNNIFKILGRTSVDIIKTGGHKVSALEIENQLLEHSSIVDVAVVGIPDVTWGQRVAAVIVSKSDDPPLIIENLKEWCSNSMASYTIPTVVRFVDTIPKNSMGKVNKKVLINELFGEFL